MSKDGKIIIAIVALLLLWLVVAVQASDASNPGLPRKVTIDNITALPDPMDNSRVVLLRDEKGNEFIAIVGTHMYSSSSIVQVR